MEMTFLECMKMPDFEDLFDSSILRQTITVGDWEKIR